MCTPTTLIAWRTSSSRPVEKVPWPILKTSSALHTVKFLAQSLCLAIASVALQQGASASQTSETGMFKDLLPLLESHCVECHDKDSEKGGLDLTKLTQDLHNRSLRERWIRIHDRVEKGEMPPKKNALPDHDRLAMVRLLGGSILKIDREEATTHGRGTLRRLNREEYQNNLRDLLQLPVLDIKDILPEDREGHHFNKATETLDMSRVQLTAYLDAAETALREAMVTQAAPPKSDVYKALGTRLFPSLTTFGNKEAMFFARDARAIVIDSKLTKEEVAKLEQDSKLEMALFRSAHWPYYGYPKGFVAKVTGEYRVRFSARAVKQLSGFTLVPAEIPQAMTFRARKPSGPDVSGDVRATGGILEIHPEAKVYETTILLKERETFEYSPLGLPVPLALNINGGAPTYRYPPLPADGQPGIAVQWLEVEGPVGPASWPPPSHKILFDELPVGKTPPQPKDEAKRLLRRFAKIAVREKIPDEELSMFEALVVRRLDKGDSFSEALLAGYQALLCSGHFLYLREPVHADDHFALASRLSYFLTNTRPDETLSDKARAHHLRSREVLRAETDRLIAGPRFERFIANFTAYWLNLRHLRRDDPDIRLYPEYRFDDYLVESMELETRAFVSAMIRENMPAKVLVQADFTFVNDRLSKHYQMPPLAGSSFQKVSLPPDSPYGGLLTQAAILKVTANGTTTSPVVRGAWVMERLLGQPPPPPPPSVPGVEPDIRGATTIRELLAAHTQNQTCAACHAKFDPVGLALENFDIFGGWRTRYRGVEQGEPIKGIDRAGHDFAYTLSVPVDASGKMPDGAGFDNIRELKQFLAANPRQLGRNLLHQFTVYATGTPVRFSDRQAIEAILDSCEKEGYRVRDLLLGLIESPVFLGFPGCQ